MSQPTPFKNLIIATVNGQTVCLRENLFQRSLKEPEGSLYVAIDGSPVTEATTDFNEACRMFGAQCAVAAGEA